MDFTHEKGLIIWLKTKCGKVEWEHIIDPTHTNIRVTFSQQLYINIQLRHRFIAYMQHAPSQYHMTSPWMFTSKPSSHHHVTTSRSWYTRNSIPPDTLRYQETVVFMEHGVFKWLLCQSSPMLQKKKSSVVYKWSSSKRNCILNSSSQINSLL
jgi:hypothetical protein